MALELRRDIAVLVAERDTEEAMTQFESLHNDLLLIYGPAQEDTQEVAEILARLRESERSGSTARDR